MAHSIDFYKFKKQKIFNVVCCFSKKKNKPKSRKKYGFKQKYYSDLWYTKSLQKNVDSEKTDEVSVLLIQPFNLKIYFYNFKLYLLLCIISEHLL